MNNKFNKDELVRVQGKEYPVVGGRLRLAHENNEVLSIETEIIEYSLENVVIQAQITTKQGVFNGLGNASSTRDKRLRQAILELAETRAIARALRFAGYGVEYTGFEEMPDEAPREQLDEGKVKALREWAEQLSNENKLDIPKLLKYYRVKDFSGLDIQQYSRIVKQLEKRET